MAVLTPAFESRIGSHIGRHNTLNYSRVLERKGEEDFLKQLISNLEKEYGNIPELTTVPKASFDKGDKYSSSS